jgi:lysophospholipase L1-like esterase
MLKGKRISILGDSISTYRGVSDDPEINGSLVYNKYYYCDPFPKERTYWQRIIDDLGLTLCVNNSYSGGTLSGKDDPCSGVSRAQNLATDDGVHPDLIIVFMGINDLGRRVLPEVFFEDYKTTLEIIRDKYPTAKTFCVNIPDRDITLTAGAKTLNAAIARAVSFAGDNFFIADLFGSRLRDDFYYMNTIDGLHPDEDGMKIISDLIKDSITKSCPDI